MKCMPMMLHQILRTQFYATPIANACVCVCKQRDEEKGFHVETIGTMHILILMLLAFFSALHKFALPAAFIPFSKWCSRCWCFCGEFIRSLVLKDILIPKLNTNKDDRSYEMPRFTYTSTILHAHTYTHK